MSAFKSIFSATYLTQKAIFESLPPAHLFLLSIRSNRSLELIESCLLNASVSIKFDSTNCTTIAVTNPKGLYSEIVVGPQTDDDGIPFEMHIDNEHFENCYLTNSGLIVPYGLEKVLRRLFSMYSSKRTFVNRLEMTVVGEKETPGLNELLTGLEKFKSVRHLVLRQGHLPRAQQHDVAGLDAFFDGLTIHESLWLGTVPSNFPSRLLTVPHLVIENGTGVSEEFIRALMDLPIQSVYIGRTEFTDFWANVTIRKWTTSDFKPQLRKLDIELAPGALDETIVSNIAHQMNEFGDRYIRKDDGQELFVTGGQLQFYFF